MQDSTIEKRRGNTGAWLRSGGALFFIYEIPRHLPSALSHMPIERYAFSFMVMLWFASCLYLLFVLARLAFFRGRGKQQAQRGGKDTGVVAWLIPRATSSPSRASAQRELPEYAAQLLQRGEQDAA